MASIVNLGYEPNRGNLILSDGADFICTLTENGTVWADGTTCTLTFPDLTGIGPYNATVTESTATAAFSIDSTATTDDLIPSGTRFHIYLTKAGTTPFLWFYGKVKREE